MTTTKILNESNKKIFEPKNERFIKRYLEHVKTTKRADNKTLIAIHKSIRSFEVLTNFKCFTEFKPEIASNFLIKLRDMDLSKSYLLRITTDTQKFLRWLANEKCGKRIKYNDVDYLNLSRNELNSARATGHQPSLSYLELLDAFRKMPDKSINDQRNRAFVAVIILGSLRANELCNLPIDSLKFDSERKVYFIDINPRHMKGVKFCKPRQPVLLNVPDLIQAIIKWRDYLINEQGCQLKAPMFPYISHRFEKNCMFERKVQPKAISPSSGERIFNNACKNAGYDALGIHSVRRTRARYMSEISGTELMVAVQQDLGHSHIATTYSNYGNLSESHKRKILSKIDIDQRCA